MYASLKYSVCVCVCVQVYNVHYSMSINGKVEEGTMEIDTANNMERFSTGSGADEAVEVHDFEIVSRICSGPACRAIEEKKKIKKK